MTQQPNGNWQSWDAEVVPDAVTSAKTNLKSKDIGHEEHERGFEMNCEDHEEVSPALVLDGGDSCLQEGNIRDLTEHDGIEVAGMSIFNCFSGETNG